MLKLIGTACTLTVAIGLIGAFFTFNSNAAHDVNALGEMSSDLFQEALKQGYKLSNNKGGFKLTSEAPDNLDDQTPSEQSGILPGEADRSAQTNELTPSPEGVDPTPSPNPTTPEQAPEQEGAEQQPQAKDEPPPSEQAQEAIPTPDQEHERAKQEEARRHAEESETKRQQHQSASKAAQVVSDYYYLIGQGRYQDAWELLSPEFKARRNLDYQGYECFWKNHQPFLKSTPKTVSIGGGRATVFSDWKVTSRGDILYSEPVKVILRWDSTSEGWLITQVESRLYTHKFQATPLEPPREHQRPVNYTIDNLDSFEED